MPEASALPRVADEAMLTEFLSGAGLEPLSASAARIAIAFARTVQMGERAFGVERDVQHNAIEARACDEKFELIHLADAANAANAEAAR